MAKKRSKARKAPARAAKAAKSSGSECCGPWGWAWLVLGLLLLLRDLGMFNVLGTASWAGLVVTLLGLQWVANK